MKAGSGGHQEEHSRQFEKNFRATMEGFPRFCQLAVITANLIALVKSVELVFVGAALLVLQPVWAVLLRDVIVTSKDLQDEVPATQVLRLVAIFMLITGPLMLLVGVVGLAGAYRKSVLGLACYLASLIVLIVVVMALFALWIPKPLVDPSDDWTPLSDLMLTSIVLQLATQAALIFFTVVLMSALAKEDNQVHPLHGH